ncbi:cysteine desulfurase family protein [Priestia taiwanensis]|uniref:cysteine desulfurase n=1 Tax=Priestia taiwanensis TaxID=1347902 RepID=A0A917AUZ3_9BACI|nr:cysteine desulfurase family protein [Priestia taiwanensis]MBM7363665.1 cysteine desulfurase [Priestia taiwanensis]GGE75086.1 cysteine desulfurase [Priestia taiwanensis]
MERIYVDHAATAPTHPEVVERMIPYMTELFGNPSSIHSFGRQARHVIDEARKVCAAGIGAKPQEIIFTSGGTEADNLAIQGVAFANKECGRHIITTKIEHHAVLHTCKELEKEGYSVTYLSVDEQGCISLDELKDALRDDTILVSVMFGNNEVGTVQPIEEIGKLLKNHQAYFHTDAVQAFGLVDIDVNELGIDLLAMSSHKINGPKGVGFLYARESVQLSPRVFGGEQERKRRAGTENVPSIVGLAHAISLSERDRIQKIDLYDTYKKVLLSTFERENIAYSLNGSSNSLPHILNISFEGISIESFLVNLDLAGIAASSGSACTAGTIDPSHVLVAMFGKGSEKLQSSIRFSFGYGNTVEQMEQLGQEIAKIIHRLTNR